MLLLTRCCLAGTTDPNIQDAKYIEYGSKYKCVQRITCDDGIASCVIISPKVAITSAHVVAKSKIASVILDDGTKIEIKNVIFPEKFLQDKNNLCDFDIAVCHLSKEVELDYFPDLYCEFNELNSICGISGFGITGKYNSISRFNDGKRRAGSNIVDAVNDFTVECSVYGGKKTSLEFMISPGDSGGGLFIDKKLAGINSLVYTMHNDKNPNSDLNDRSCHVRVSKHSHWIKTCITVFNKMDEIEETNEKNR